MRLVVRCKVTASSMNPASQASMCSCRSVPSRCGHPTQHSRQNATASSMALWLCRRGGQRVHSALPSRRAASPWLLPRGCCHRASRCEYADSGTGSAQSHDDWREREPQRQPSRRTQRITSGDKCATVDRHSVCTATDGTVTPKARARWAHDRDDHRGTATSADNRLRSRPLERG